MQQQKSSRGSTLQLSLFSCCCYQCCNKDFINSVVLSALSSQNSEIIKTLTLLVLHSTLSFVERGFILCYLFAFHMKNSHVPFFLAPFLLFVLVFHVEVATAFGTQDGMESWGYVEVRPKAHIFWWYYRSPYRTQDLEKPWPVILWLQGGPGASGVVFGNFKEIGPLDSFLKPRNSTWLRKADLLFVDNPVGTGFSFVEDLKLFVKTDDENAADMTTVLIKIFNRNVTLQKSPLYIVGESYGGKLAVTLGLSVLKAIEAGKLNLKLGGIALGNSWISPEDFVLSWGPLLKDLSRLDDNALLKSNRLALQIKKQLQAGEFENASRTWIDLEKVISVNSDSVDFYNFLLNSFMDPLSSTSSEINQGITVNRYLKYLSSPSSPFGGWRHTLDFVDILRKKLKIIPKNVTWGGQVAYVFISMRSDFMRPRINEVDELLAKGVHVTIYNGQIDLICATKGVEAWVGKLKWNGLKNFLRKDRTPLYCGNDTLITKGFKKSYRNFHFYWILGAGHFVPVYQPCVSLAMIGNITQSPAA